MNRLDFETHPEPLEVSILQPKTKLVWLSVRRALVLTAVLYLIVGLFAPIFVGDPVTPLLERFPLAWILYWPKLFLGLNSAVSNRDLVICLGFNIAAYSVVIYTITYLLRRRERMKPRLN